jgi:hypothetical protein
MDIYTSDTSYIIRHDFMRFSSESRRRDARATSEMADQKTVASALEKLRREMTEDDGRSSFGTYKCPIF